MRTSSFPALLCSLMAASLACGVDGEGRDSATSVTVGASVTTVPTTTGNETTGEESTTDPMTTTTTTGDGDGDMTTSTSGIKLDTISDEEGPGTATAEAGGGEGCEAIDFLFVIDNSGSMGDNQQNLINSFPGFISKIQETIADVDSYHIMVVKTDEYWNDCTIECNFFPFLCQFDGVDGCAGPPTVCDATLGSGVNFPIGDDASNQYCDLTGGQRYITPQEPLNLLPQKFTCIASVGTDGDSSEKPMGAMTEAVGPALNGPGGCNTGFLRDEAVLVITIITDEEDGDSNGTPAGWYQNIIAQKAGDGSGVVVLGLINDEEGICPVESQQPLKIREFIESFPNHIEGSVCEQNYAPFFDQAVELINDTCDEYVPVG